MMSGTNIEENDLNQSSEEPSELSYVEPSSLITVASSYDELKHQLETLEYDDAFTTESMPLIRKLLSDLFLSTDNHEKLNQEVQELRAAASFKTQLVEKIVEENKQLRIRSSNLEQRTMELEKIQTESQEGRDIHIKTLKDNLKYERYKSQQQAARLSELQRKKGSSTVLNEPEKCKVCESRFGSTNDVPRLDHLELKVSNLQREKQSLQKQVESFNGKMLDTYEWFASSFQKALQDGFEDDTLSTTMRELAKDFHQLISRPSTVHRTDVATETTESVNPYEQIEILREKMHEMEDKLRKTLETNDQCSSCKTLQAQNEDFLSRISDLSTKITLMDSKFKSLSDIEEKYFNVRREFEVKDDLVQALEKEIDDLKEYINIRESETPVNATEKLALNIHDLEKKNKNLLLENETLKQSNANISQNIEEMQQTIIHLGNALQTQQQAPDIIEEVEDATLKSNMETKLEEAKTLLAEARHNVSTLNEKVAWLEKELNKRDECIQELQEKSNAVSEKEPVYKETMTDESSLNQREINARIHVMQEEKASLEESLERAKLYISDLKESIFKGQDDFKASEDQKVLLEELFKTKDLEVTKRDDQLRSLKNVLQDNQEIMKEKASDLNRLTMKLEARDEEITFLKRKVHASERNFEAAKSDLKVMIQDNQHFNQTNQLLRSELNSCRAKLKEFITQRRGIESTFSKAKMEKNEILKAYKRALEELDRLKLIVDKYHHKFTLFNMKTQEKDEEIKNLNVLVTSLEDKVRAQLIDLKSYQRQVNNLTTEVKASNSRMANMENTSQKVLKIKSNADLAVKKLINREKSLKIEVAELESDLDRMKNKLKLAENESSVLNNLLMKDRKRAEKLEEIIEKLRHMDAKNKVFIKNQEAQLKKLNSLARFDYSDENKTKEPTMFQDKKHKLPQKAMSDITNLRTGAKENSLAPETTTTSEIGKENSIRLSQPSGELTTSDSQESNLVRSRYGGNVVEEINETKEAPQLRLFSPARPNFTFEESLNVLNSKDLEKQCKELEEMISEQSQIIRDMESS